MVRKSNRGSIVTDTLTRARARRYDARRDGILRAAAADFRERGFSDAGMRDGAVAADLSPANLYHYFTGKDELLGGVADSRRVRPDTGDRICAVLVTHVRTMLDELEGGTAYFQAEGLARGLRGWIVRKRDRNEHAVRRLVSEGIRDGVFMAAKAARLTRPTFGALNGIVTWHRPAGRKRLARSPTTCPGISSEDS